MTSAMVGMVLPCKNMRWLPREEIQVNLRKVTDNVEEVEGLQDPHREKDMAGVEETTSA